MVRATPPALYLTHHSHARAFATHRCGVDATMAEREADGRREQLRERVSAGCVRPDGGGAGGGSSEAGRAYDRATATASCPWRHGYVMGCMREGVDGLFNDWRRMKRARTELIGVRKRVIVLRLHCAAERALSLALDILSASVTRRRPASSSPPIRPPLSQYLTPAGLVPISSSS